SDFRILAAPTPHRQVLIASAATDSHRSGVPLHRRIAAITAFIALLFSASATIAAPAQSAPSMSHPSIAGMYLEHATIPDLQHAMKTGRLSSVRLTEFYLRRIRAFNPMLHAVIGTNPDALRPAEAADARRHR